MNCFTDFFLQITEVRTEEQVSVVTTKVEEGRQRQNQGMDRRLQRVAIEMITLI